MVIAGNSGSAANREDDGQEVVPCLVTQGPQEPADKPHQQQEEGGVSIQDGNGDGGRRSGVTPPISRVVGSNEAVGNVHSRSPTITGSTNDASEERMRSSDLDGV